MTSDNKKYFDKLQILANLPRWVLEAKINEYNNIIPIGILLKVYQLKGDFPDEKDCKILILEGFYTWKSQYEGWDNPLESKEPTKKEKPDSEILKVLNELLKEVVELRKELGSKIQ